ncbi:MAG: 2-C-methyl-D-erythritol 4-phosphate cytidylyltransferase [Candidatus Cloacimonetes bacterium]|nr:2-C-methyl-D-erythritol 4-phosphate cytidylyltransferase [Candidatus Cloacimonadota bacterium]MCF7813898.1 2-C-methyl-D-erythritol 4-phosphate cytidylyltransferase [Candidatus Cloacimonadota bacterium]MCF7868891.1 2-C-methyl-D-erythritol 4-phosphate cytidylyltransferase [Candidatus Cloacimonadota bacterium]MCF7884010.1 2-C-methyl-D-erythritol 4-phosphate cytidylyltransferase [Candidatus Cloacimonadota bacterium]
MRKNIAIITAGGSGRRFGSNKKKQFVEIANRPILFWTIDKFVRYDEIHKIIITLPPEDFAEQQELIEKEFHSHIFKFVKGGKERQNSVFNALSACSRDTDFVFIHDGVRPFISLEEIKKLHENALKFDAVIPGYKVKNTIKQIGGNQIKKTVPRQALIAVLTPQIFRYSIIWECHQKAKKDNIICTDDAALLEYFNIPVHWIECSSKNIKITEPNDLRLAEFYLKNEMEKNT